MAINKAQGIHVLIACEESQEECKAFRLLGFEAFSCDIQPCSGGHPEWHIQRDVLDILNPKDHGNNTLDAIWFVTMDGHFHEVTKWDLIIAHPPCTDLAASGARHFVRKRADGSQQRSISFFLCFANLSCEKVAIENPVGIMSSIYRKPDQIIQPWHYGHPVSKKTCLWLKGLPLLHPTNIVEPGKTDKYGFTIGAALQMVRDENGKILSWNDPRTAKARSKTFPGVAAAMAEQWGRVLMEEVSDNGSKTN